MCYAPVMRRSRHQKAVDNLVVALLALPFLVLIIVLWAWLTSWVVSLLPGWAIALGIVVYLGGVFVYCVVMLFCALLDR